MSSAIVTLVLVILTVSIAIVLYSYYTSLYANSYANLAPLQTAMELAKELQVSYSIPVVGYVVPTQKGQPLNFSVNTLVTLNMNYSGVVYVIPFLMNASYSPYYYAPSPMFSNGYVNEVSKPNLVGYANVSGKGVKVVQLNNAEIYSLDGVVAIVSGYAFEVPLNELLNFTYTTNQSYVPAFWVVANISGKYYRVAYPVIVFRPIINTYSGSASTVKIVTSSNTRYITPVALNPTNPIYVAGWFSLVPNNASINVVNATLLNQTYQVSLTLVAVPKSPSAYSLVLHVNSTPYVLATVSPYESYMYVIEGYVQGSTTYVEVIILSESGLITSKTLQVTLPLYTGIIVTVGQEPNYQVLVYAGSSNNPWQTIYNDGPYVNSTQYLEQVSNQVSYLQYYYLISPPTSLEFQMQPTYYVSSIGPLVLNVETNSLSYVA